MVECQASEQNLCGIGVASLPDEEAPPLPICPEVRNDLDVEEHLGVSERGQDRCDYDPCYEEARYWRIREAGGLHNAG